MSLQYVLYDYWEYGYAEGDAILEFGSASVTANATVSASGIRLRTAVGSITGSATVSAQGIRVRTADAGITASAVLTADGTRVRTSSGSITGTATVSALGGIVASGDASITGFATVSALGNATFSANAAVSGNVTVTAAGGIIGGDWVDVVPEANTWVSIRIQDPYVDIDYWEDGYTDDRYDYWTRPSISTDSWMRQ